MMLTLHDEPNQNPLLLEFQEDKIASVKRLLDNPDKSWIVTESRWLGNDLIFVSIWESGTRKDRRIIFDKSNNSIGEIDNKDGVEIWTPSRDGEELIRQNREEGELSTATIFKKNSEGKFESIPSSFSLGHKVKMGPHFGPAVFDKIFSVNDPELILHLRYLKNGTHEHELVVRKRHTFEELYSIDLPINDQEPKIKISADGKQVEIGYQWEGEVSIGRAIIISVEDLK